LHLGELKVQSQESSHQEDLDLHFFLRDRFV
jgi:hypothetical protein